MIYGYNSKLSTNGVDTIMDYSRGLIEELKKIRDTQEVSAVTECSSGAVASG
jgi:thiamine monophosphate kinase